MFIFEAQSRAGIICIFLIMGVSSLIPNITRELELLWPPFLKPLAQSSGAPELRRPQEHTGAGGPSPAHCTKRHLVPLLVVTEEPRLEGKSSSLA